MADQPGLRRPYRAESCLRAYPGLAPRAALPRASSARVPACDGGSTEGAWQISPACAALTGLNRASAHTRGLHPGLLCRALPALASRPPTTEAPKVHGRSAQAGGRKASGGLGRIMRKREPWKGEAAIPLPADSAKNNAVDPQLAFYRIIKFRRSIAMQREQDGFAS